MKFLQKKLPYTARFYFLPAAFLVAIIATNAYIFLANPFGAEAPSQFSDSQGLPAPLKLPSNLLPIDQVKNLALSEAPQATITKIELENKDEKLVYVISFTDNTQLAFDAQTGAKISAVAATNSQSKEALPSDFTPTIGFDRAQEVALAQKPNGLVSKIELISEGSTPLYRVVFADGSFIDIAAEDGTIVRQSSTPQKQPNSSKPAPSTTNSVPNIDPSEPQSNQLEVIPEPTENSESN